MRLLTLAIGLTTLTAFVAAQTTSRQTGRRPLIRPSTLDCAVQIAAARAPAERPEE